MLRIIKKLLKIKSNPQIIGFRGYGAHNTINVIGRVTEKTGTAPSEKKLGALKNAQALLKRYLAAPLPDLKVQITWRDAKTYAITNQNGMFYASLTMDNLPEDPLEWHSATATLCTCSNESCITQPEILMKSKNNEYGIISDIDDTILVSSATKKLTLVYKTLTQDSHTRKPFDGIVELLHSFRQGKSGSSNNPIFYVSSSQWNLYDYLVEFMRINEFPKGVLLLKEIGSIWTILKSVGNHSHKADRIREILNTFDNLNFVLIGDSGQQDAAIYSDIIKEFSDRIKAVYIRDVTVKENILVTNAVKTHGKAVPFILVKTSKEAADHATEINLIQSDKKKAIEKEVAANQEQ